MEKIIYEVYSFESNEWVECDKYEYDKTEDKYRRITEGEQGEQGELYRWVKASERLPIRRQKSSVKLYHGGISLKVRDREATGFFVSFDDKIFCDYKIHESDSTGGCGTIPEDRFYEIEWLCKLSSPPPEGQLKK